MVYWATCQFREWQFFLAATDQGLCYVGSPNAPFSELEQWVRKHMDKADILVENEEKLAPACKEVRQYLSGETKDFLIPIDIRGTTFQKKVWQAMCDIPYGEKNTYTDIAQRIGNIKAVRAVASAIGANPLMIVLPCHRVIAKNGGLAGFRGGLEMKRFLLHLEQMSS